MGKEKPTIKLTGTDGNAFSLIAKAEREMKKNGVPKSEIDAFFDEATSGDYQHVIATIAKHFRII